MREILGTGVAAGEANGICPPTWIQGLLAARGWSQLNQEELLESHFGKAAWCAWVGAMCGIGCFLTPTPTPGMAHPPQEWLTFHPGVWLSMGANGNIPD